MAKQTQYRPKQMRLNNMPEDVKRIVLEEQRRLKERCHCQKNQEQVIYSLIRKAAGHGE